MTTATITPRYWVRGGLEGRAIGVLRQHPDGTAESWAWGRWVPIPAYALPPDYDDVMTDEVDEATAMRIVADPDLFDDERGPDPEQAEGGANRRGSSGGTRSATGRS